VKLRLFADQCIPLEIVLAMRGLGHEVLLLRDHLPIRSVDTLVIAKAQEQECLLLSLNGDFAQIVTYPPGSF
jgi:predicted nuclease of predicted toxin-antitoxin system